MRNKISSEELAWLEDMRQQGERGLYHFFMRYDRSLRSWLQAQYSLSEADAHEVSNDVFHEFYKTIHNFRQEASVLTWLCRIGHYRSLDKIRAHKGRHEAEIEDELLLLNQPSLEDIERELCYQQCLARLINAVEQENPYSDCLKVLTLQAYGQSIDDIAKALNRSTGATRVFMTACRKKLESHWLKQCQEDCDL